MSSKKLKNKRYGSEKKMYKFDLYIKKRTDFLVPNLMTLQIEVSWVLNVYMEELVYYKLTKLVYK